MVNNKEIAEKIIRWKPMKSEGLPTEVQKVVKEFNNSNKGVHRLWINRRNKDFNRKIKSTTTLKTYDVHSYEYLCKIWDNVVKTCEREGARAYMSINPRPMGAIAANINQMINEYNKKGDYTGMADIFWKAFGKTKQLPKYVKKVWLFDVDTTNEVAIEKLINILREKEVFFGEYPTSNGSHILSTGFNPNDVGFILSNYDIELQKDAQALLYAPSFQEKN